MHRVNAVELIIRFKIKLEPHYENWYEDCWDIDELYKRNRK